MVRHASLFRISRPIHLFLPTFVVLWSSCTTAPDYRLDRVYVPETRREINWQPLYQGVALYTDRLPDGPLSVYALRINTHDPAVSFLVTPSNGDRPLDTDSMRTTSFLARFDLQVAVNASPFRQIHFAEGFPTDIVGLSMSDGHLYSPPENDFGVLLFYRDGSVRISDAPDTYERVEQAVGGFAIVLQAGEIVGAHAARHPRTAAGTSEDGRMLYFLLIDGRQAFYSIGATEYELGAWLQHLGAHTGINLDGGGSTTLVIESASGRSTIVNSPIGYDFLRIERAVGNHIGVRARRLE